MKVEIPRYGDFGNFGGLGVQADHYPIVRYEVWYRAVIIGWL